MYNRSHGRRRPPIVPQNYSGNAFYRIPYEEKPPADAEFHEVPPCETERERQERCESSPPCECECECERECECKSGHAPILQPIHSQKPSLPFLGGKLFPHGIGNEELLILALILITAGNEDCSDLLLCLILLLFC